MNSLQSIKGDFAFGGELGWYQHAMTNDLAVSPPSCLSQDEIDTYWMSVALRISMHAAGVSSPNPPVGCVIVKDTICIAQGWTSRFGGKHAETNALDMLKPGAARGATAYVTLEPCSHHGKQGPCVEALIAAGISRCVIACNDPNPLVNGRGIAALKNHGVTVVVGTMSAIVEPFLAPFFVHVRYQRPFLALKWAQTANGLLARDDGSSKWISNESSRAYSHWLRHRYDIIVVGPNTVLVDQPRLTVRNISSSLIQRQPLRVILDPRGLLQDMDKVLQQQLSESVCNSDAHTVYIGPGVRLNIANKSEFSAIEVPPNLTPSQALLDAKTLSHLSERLGRPLQSIQIEGGRATLCHFLNADLYDALHIFKAPHTWEGSRYKIDFLATCLNTNKFSFKIKNRLADDELYEFLR